LTNWTGVVANWQAKQLERARRIRWGTRASAPILGIVGDDRGIPPSDVGDYWSSTCGHGRWAWL